jgi:hypothetical protein
MRVDSISAIPHAANIGYPVIGDQYNEAPNKSKAGPPPSARMSIAAPDAPERSLLTIQRRKERTFD